jgi:hypothetical protein
MRPNYIQVGKTGHVTILTTTRINGETANMRQGLDTRFMIIETNSKQFVVQYQDDSGEIKKVWCDYPTNKKDGSESYKDFQELKPGSPNGYVREIISSFNDTRGDVQTIVKCIYSIN